MKHLSRSILLLICQTVLFVSFVVGQERPQILKPNEPITFSLSSDEEKVFQIEMKKGDFAQLLWIANAESPILFSISDSTDKILKNVSAEEESIYFTAPKDGVYYFKTKLNKSENPEQQRVSVEYKNTFKLPKGTKQIAFRNINDYIIRIFATPNIDYLGDSIVVIEKNGQIQEVIKSSGNGSSMGFHFSDDLNYAYDAKVKKGVALIKQTLDKTGDGVPDVILEYYSGGAHCCISTYFINLGESVELLDVFDTGHDGLVATGKSPRGGLIFTTSDTSFAYWLTGFAQSYFPEVKLEFKNGKLRPNFILMKRNPPSLVTLKNKANKIRFKIGTEPYLGEAESSFDIAFWDVMLDLVYSGNEELAWQYLDLVWLPDKRGKELFIKDFKNQLAESPYWQMIKEDKK